MIFCTNTPAFCKQLTGKPPRLDADESLEVGAGPTDAWPGTAGTGAAWIGRTLADILSSVWGGRLRIV